MTSVALMLATAIGCNPARKKVPGPVETPMTPDEQMAERKAASGDSSGAARIYANLGEGVFFDHGPALADPLFDKALAQNPNESKALFYTAFTKPLVAMAGFLPRAEGVLGGSDPMKEQTARRDLETMGFPDLFNWAYTIPAGAAPFATLHDIQRFLRTELLPIIDNSVLTLGKIDPANPPALLMSFSKFKPHDPDLQPGHISHGRPDDHPLYCEQRKSDGSWFCKPAKGGVVPRAVKLDKSDLTVMTRSVHAISDYIRLNTAYSTEGWDLARIQIKEMHGHAHGITPQDAAILSQYPSLFTLESDQLLGQIQATTFAALQDAEDLASLDATLCGSTPTRIKNNAFFASICVHDDMLRAVVKGIEVLNGPTEISVGRDDGDTQVMLALNVPSILGNPPKDLKPLLVHPASGASDFTAFPDSTFSGLFPDADFKSAFSRVTHRANWNQVPERMGSYGIIPYPYR